MTALMETPPLSFGPGVLPPDRNICKGCGQVFPGSPASAARELVAHVEEHRAGCDGTDCQHGNEGTPCTP